MRSPVCAKLKREKENCWRKIFRWLWFQFLKKKKSSWKTSCRDIKFLGCSKEPQPLSPEREKEVSYEGEEPCIYDSIVHSSFRSGQISQLNLCVFWKTEMLLFDMKSIVCLGFFPPVFQFSYWGVQFQSIFGFSSFGKLQSFGVLPNLCEKLKKEKREGPFFISLHIFHRKYFTFLMNSAFLLCQFTAWTAEIKGKGSI